MRGGPGVPQGGSSFGYSRAVALVVQDFGLRGSREFMGSAFNDRGEMGESSLGLLPLAGGQALQTALVARLTGTRGPWARS